MTFLLYVYEQYIKQLGANRTPPRRDQVTPYDSCTPILMGS